MVRRKRWIDLAALTICCAPVLAVAADTPADQDKKQEGKTVILSKIGEKEQAAKDEKKPQGKLTGQKKEEALAALRGKQEELKYLQEKASEVTKGIGDLAASGKLPQDQEALALMRKMVDELTEIKNRVTKMEEEIQGIKGWIEGQSENLPIMQNDIADLKRHKEGNYVQFQYTDTDRKGGAFDAFRMRRIRLGITETIDPRTSMKISFDLATGTNQTSAQLRDAFLTYDIVPSDTMVGTAVVFGQQPLPLGYELERSSSDREFPERAQYNQVLFNGERSRGVSLRHGLTQNSMVQIGVYNALTFNDPEQANLAAGPGNRLGVFGGLKYYGTNYEFGISGYKAERPAFTANAITSPKLDREFIYLDGSYIGLFSPNLFIRGELMLGKDRIPSSTAAVNKTQKDMMGYHVILGYNLNYRNQINFKYEQFDPNTDADNDLFKGYGLSYQYFINPNAKFLLAHEIFEDETRASQNQIRYQVTTFRVQFKF